MARRNNTISKDEMFANAPVLEALAVMAVPTIISQLINLIYNMVDAFFIGRTGNSYMMAATTITLTMVMLNVAFSNLFGVGGGSLVARLMGRREPGYARQVSAFSVYGAITLAVTYSVLVGVFLDPVLRLLGASDATIGFARQYALIVIVLGSLPSILSLTLAHLLRNAGYSGQASLGLSMGGVLNMALDPLFMFVLLPRGQEVVGAAIATTLSNVIACLYLLIAVKKATAEAPLSMRLRDAIGLEKHFVRDIFSVGVPSAMLTGMFDLANICLNVISAAHSDLVLAAMGIVMKVERLPNAINVGLSQGMMPIVAYNYASGNEERMNEVIRKTRYIGALRDFCRTGFQGLPQHVGERCRDCYANGGLCGDVPAAAMPRFAGAVHQLQYVLLHAGHGKGQGDLAARDGAPAGILHPDHVPYGSTVGHHRPCVRAGHQ